MAAVPKVPGMATGKGSGNGEGRGNTGKGRNRSGQIALVLETAEAAPAVLLEALIRPWFGFGRKCGGEEIQTLRSCPGSVLVLLDQGQRHPHTPAPHPHAPRGHPNSVTTLVSLVLGRSLSLYIGTFGTLVFIPHPGLATAKLFAAWMNCFPPSVWRWDKHEGCSQTIQPRP